MDKKQRLRTLSKKEIVTVYLICQNLTNNQIAETFNQDPKTIGSRITKIYLKLDIKGDDLEKRLMLLKDYCPLVREFTEKELRYWVPEKPPPDVKIKYELIEYEFPDPGDDDFDFPLLPPPQIPLTPPPHPPGPSPQGDGVVPVRFVRQLMLILLSVIAVLLVILGFFIFRTPPESPLNPPENSEPPESISVTSTPDLSPTITIEVVVPIIPTSTTSPTETPTITPTETPTLVPTPTPVILFSDDFSGDLSKWTQLGFPPFYPNNRVVIANEAITTSDVHGAWVVANIPAETNYQIIINFESKGCGGSGNYFSTAFDDTYNMISLNADACQFHWGYTKGSHTLYKYSGTRGLAGSGKQRLVITVRGNKISAELNRTEAFSVFNEKHAQGKIAIYIKTNDIIDDVTVIAMQE